MEISRLRYSFKGRGRQEKGAITDVKHSAVA